MVTEWELKSDFKGGAVPSNTIVQRIRFRVWPKWAHGKAPEIEKTATGDQSTEVKVGEQPPYKIPSSQAYSPCPALIPRGVVLAARLSLSLYLSALHILRLFGTEEKIEEARN